MGPLSRILDNAKLILRWLLIILPIGVAVGSVVALFLWLLDWSTITRSSHPWLIYLLPLAGLVIVYSYRAAGKNADAGNNLIYFAIACFVAYAFSGHTGIYGSQRVAVPKPGEVRQHLTLSQLRNAQNRFLQWLKEKRQ